MTKVTGIKNKKTGIYHEIRTNKGALEPRICFEIRHEFKVKIKKYLLKFQ